MAIFIKEKTIDRISFYLREHQRRSVLDHLRESITNLKIQRNVRAYTAIVGKNGQGDFKNIQDAIDYVEKLGSGSILILSGTYTLSASLVIKKNDVILSGQGAASIITLANSVNDDVIQIEATDGVLERVSILNLKIDGNGANQTAGRGIHTIKSGAGTTVSDITIKNLEITAVESYAIYLDFATDPKRCLVENNYIHDNLSFGIYIGDGEDNLVTNNIVKNNTSIGIYFNSGKHNMAINNRVEGGTAGIRLSNGETQDIISGNLIFNCSGDGILLQDNVSHTVVEGNFIDAVGSGGAGTNGIQATAFTGICQHNVISDNVILNSANAGIELYNNTDNPDSLSLNTIVGNTISDSGKDGIKMRGVTVNIIQGNIFGGNSKDMNNTYTDIFLTDNGRGSPNYSLYNVIEGNNIECMEANKSKYGIRENDANNDRNIVLGNIVYGAVVANISTQGVNTEIAHNIG